MNSRFISRSVFALGVAALVASGSLLTGGVASAASPATMRAASGEVSYTVFGWQNRAISAPVTLAGRFTDVAKGSSAQLVVRTFPFSGAKTPGPTQKLTVRPDASALFSFIVRPQIATQYWVRLIKPDGSLGRLYRLQSLEVVSTRYTVFDWESCVNRTCKLSFTLFRYLPPAVSSYELAKPYYEYLGITWSSSNTPPAPKRLSLVHGWAVSRTTAVANGKDEFQTTFSFSFKMQQQWFSLASTACTIDSVAKDGFGRATSSGCGDRSVPLDASYLG